MADKIKILFTSSCKVGGKHIEKGSVVDIDPDVAADRANYALLVHAGRICAATKANVEKLEKEMELEEAVAAEHSKHVSGATAHEQIAAAVVKALADAGLLGKKASA